ncbi:Ca2+-binding RTX toxin-like protein [Inquilinus ginsengisoli]|uniref:M10 family metallopeptidase C-terminal domain-containing protein n=1 Tax=Inquilinus ginsengisoli TaxID=363840 RepID=UPI003D25E6F3
MTELQEAVSTWDYLNIYGTDGDDHLVVPANDYWNYVEAYAGSDLIEVDPRNTGNVSIQLEDGGDTIHGGPGSEHVSLWDEAGIGHLTFTGGAGDDSVSLGIYAQGPGSVLDGGDGKDEVSFFGRGVFVHLENGTALVGPKDQPDVFYETTVRDFEDASGTGGHDILVGTDGGNLLRAWGGDDLLSGHGGTDRLEGGGGDDVLVGGLGADGLSSGPGADIIRIDRLAESLPGQEDTILDLTSRDRIDLSRIDADLGAAGDQAFDFIGMAAFSGAAGELRYEAVGSDLLVSADADGDGVADLAIKIRDLTQLAASDFIL